MAWASRVPAAIDGLAAAVAAAVDSGATAVRTGPIVTAASVLEEIVVGFVDDDQTQSAATGVLAFKGLALVPLGETFTISCAVRVLTGATDVVAGRNRCYQLLSTVGAALAADKTLGGAVALARVGAYTLQPTQTPNGLLTALHFGVDCEAFTAT